LRVTSAGDDLYFAVWVLKKSIVFYKGSLTNPEDSHPPHPPLTTILKMGFLEKVWDFWVSSSMEKLQLSLEMSRL
jgi:hypothetical protein